MPSSISLAAGPANSFVTSLNVLTKLSHVFPAETGAKTSASAVKSFEETPSAFLHTTEPTSYPHWLSRL